MNKHKLSGQTRTNGCHNVRSTSHLYAVYERVAVVLDRRKRRFGVNVVVCDDSNKLILRVGIYIMWLRKLKSTKLCNAEQG